MKRAIFLLLLSIPCMLGFSSEPPTLKSFAISDVKLLGGPFYQAQQSDLEYILALEPDRLLAPFLKDAGFEPKKENYGNWEGSGLNGHIGGHYLSALAMMHAATGNAELNERLNYMIDWLDKCQEKNGNGYVGGIPDGQKVWEEIKNGQIDAGNFSLNDRWVPLYNIHKLYAGLRDAYIHAGNEQALEILVTLTDWMADLTADLSDKQLQQMLQSEHGGLNEVFVDVAELTGDDRYLELARRFSHRQVLDPLLQYQNELTGMHANTQIPKVIGYKRYADATNNASWDAASEYFWKLMINEWTVSIGGNSVREHLHPTNDFSSMVESREGPETCNTYNMLRLTKMLHLTDPKAKYLDYYERALYNHILSSGHPTKTGFVYFTPMRPGHYRVYSQPEQCFWCCVGSGLENHAKYGEMIYAHDENDVYVNMFIASELDWNEKGIKLIQKTDFPKEAGSTIKVDMNRSKTFAIHIRKPSWVKDGTFAVRINGEAVELTSGQSPYIPINRTWQPGDEITVSLPMQTQVEYLPDNSSWASVIHGPVVLAAIKDSSNLEGLWADDSRMGHIAHGELFPRDQAPFVVTTQQDFSSLIEPIDGKPMQFRMPDLLYPDEFKDLVLRPFYEVHEARYFIYWPVATPEGVKLHQQMLEEKEKAMMALEAITIDKVAPGEQQPESDHNFKGEDTHTGRHENNFWRDAGGWFSYDLKDAHQEGTKLRVKYGPFNRDRAFVIKMNETVLDTVKLEDRREEEFFTVDYEIPEALIQGSKGKLIVKFEAINNKRTAQIFYVRLLKE